MKEATGITNYLFMSNEDILKDPQRFSSPIQDSLTLVLFFVIERAYNNLMDAGLGKCFGMLLWLYRKIIFTTDIPVQFLFLFILCI